MEFGNGIHCYTNPNFLYSTLSGQRPLTLSVSKGVDHTC
jgi:hypothetical protein